MNQGFIKIISITAQYFSEINNIQIYRNSCKTPINSYEYKKPEQHNTVSELTQSSPNSHQ